MNVLKSNILLLITSAIWGFAFVAQRVGMEYVGPFTFNGIRFMLGGLSLLPVILFLNNRSSKSIQLDSAVWPGILAGIILCVASSLQQVGMIDTSAGKAAFITSLYIVMVPVVGLFLRQKMTAGTWPGVLLAVIGLYLLCVQEKLYIQRGDFFILMSSICWTAHILVIGRYSPRVDVLKLSCIQFLTCGIISAVIAVVGETIVLRDIQAAVVPIFYGGFCSVGIAYTLQVVGQKYAPPSHASIIMSMESVFAVLGGFLLLGETLQTREVTGCLLMFSGMLVSQLYGRRTRLEERLYTDR